MIDVMINQSDMKMAGGNMSVYCGDKHARFGANLDVRKNMVTAPVGPSGRGKSTYLRMPDRLNGTIEGCRVGMVFRKPHPLPKPIYESVACTPRIHGLARNRTAPDRIVHSYLPRAVLSGGRQQRLRIARAATVSPEVILMDEPSSALAPIATAKVEELIHELRENLTIAIVTYSMQQAARVSQRTAIFHLGHPARENDIARIFINPDDQRTQDYIMGRFDRSKTAPAAPAGGLFMPTAHIYSAFDEELSALSRRIAEMGGMAEQMVADSVRALVSSDAALAQRVISEDVLMDQVERDIGDNAILMIAKRQPVASDLREIVGSIRIAADLERVGDLGKSNAKRVIAVQTTGIPRPLARGIEHLSELALVQLKDVLDVYSTRSAEKAEAIRQRDGEIDAVYTSLFREMLTYMMEDPRNITPCTHLLFCAKNIERIGDHATNIAETIYYMKTGEQPVGERSKDDNTASVVQPV